MNKAAIVLWMNQSCTSCLPSRCSDNLSESAVV